MINYTTIQQIEILGNCKNAEELLEIKEILQEVQEIDTVTQLLFDRKMKSFLVQNQITSDE